MERKEPARAAAWKGNVKVLHVIDSLDLGGAQETLLNLAKYAARGQFSLRVASMHRKGVYGPRVSAHRVPVHSLSPHKFLPLYFGRLVWLIRSFRPDIVHCHLTWANILAKPLARLCGIRALINHDQTNERFRHARGLRFQLDRITNKLSSHVIAVSKSIADFLVEAEGVPRDRVSVIPNGVDLERFPKRDKRDFKLRREWGIPAGAFVVGGIGRLHPQKNFSRFIRIARRASDNNADFIFVIAGDGPLREELQREASMLGVSGIVRFIGYAPDTSQVFPALDAFMMTSDYEGLPVALLEAMATGVPSVCSAVDGISETVTHGVEGLLAEPNDEAEFFSALRRLAESSELRETLADNARRAVETRFSAQAMTRSVEKIYRKVLGV